VQGQLTIGSQVEAMDDGALRRRGILVVAGATAVMALGFGGLALTAVFMQALEAEFGWSRSEVSFAYALATVGMALGGAFWGRLADRVAMRTMLAIGGSGMALALLTMAAAQSLWQIYIANLAFGGLGFAVLYAPLLAASGEWFGRARGVAIGIVTAGGALGQGVLPYLASILIAEAGWRNAFLGIAILTAMALLLALPRIAYPDGKEPARCTSGSAHKPLSRREKQRIAMLAIAAFMCCLCMGVPLVHLASFVATTCGSTAMGATTLLVAMLFGAVGRICFGFAADRIGYLQSYALASAIQTVCVVAFPSLGGSVPLLMLSAVFGFGFAGNMTCLVLCIRETVPAHRFGSALGIVMLVAWAGMGSGGYSGGVLFDAVGSYLLAFALAGVAGVFNLAAIAVLAVMRSRREPASE
jgi:MFS family permease